MDLIHALSETTSKSEKIDLIKQASDDEFTAKVFQYALNPYTTYRMKWSHVNLDRIGYPSTEMFELLDAIIAGQYAGNAAKNYVLNFAEVHGDLIKLIINKNLRCGVGAALVNKCFTSLIPVFQIQKAKEVPIDTLEYPQLCQLKYDGVRLIARVEDGKVTFRSSGGRLAVFAELCKAISDSEMLSGILDGELIWDKGTQADRTIIAGKLNSAMKGGTVDESKMKFVVFDTLTLAEFDHQNSEYRYDFRLFRLKSLIRTINNIKVQLAETFLVHSAEEANIVYGKFISYGFEGVVLKDPKSSYTFKRSKDWVKVKETKTADLRCIGWTEGTNSNAGLIGSLSLEGEVEGNFVRVNVHSGMSDLDIRKDPEHYLEEIIEVKYNSVIMDSVTQDYSLFLPRYVTVRIDK